MRAAVLADAGPLYAAVDPHDAHHQRALQDLQRLARSKREVMISFSTLIETYSLVLHRIDRNIAYRWLTEMADAALINPTPEDYRQAARKVGAFPDQRITLFDATVAVLAARLGLEVWTYDHDFDLMRVQVWR